MRAPKEPTVVVDLSRTGQDILHLLYKLPDGSRASSHPREWSQRSADQLPSGSNGAPPKQSTVRKLAPPIVRDADDRQVLKEVVDFYHDALKQSPEALQYLEKRGLKSSAMLEHFQLGFANRTLGYRLPNKNRQEGAELRGRLQKLGVLRESGHEHFNGAVVIPILDREGAVLGMYGRKITPNLREGTPLHLYLPGPHRGVWNEAALAASKEIILCEALIDALTFWCAGYRQVTASYGVNGFTEDHQAAFRKHGTRKVFIAYDRDEAGEAAAGPLAEELLGMGIDCYRVLFPKGLDANEYALKVQPATKSLGLLLNRAEWLGKGKRPAVTVNVPMTRSESTSGEEGPQEAGREKNEIATQEETETAAKEKISEPAPATLPEQLAAAEVLSLVAETVASDPRPRNPEPGTDPESLAPSPQSRTARRRGTRRRHHPHAGRPPLPCPGPGQEPELRTLEDQPAGVECESNG